MKQSYKPGDIAFEFMDALTSPIITHDISWADTIPHRLIECVKISRLEALHQKEEMGTYPEVVAYLMTASFQAPLSNEWAEIYFHTACTVAERYWEENHWNKIHAKRKLSDYEVSQHLNPLRRWLYEKRRDCLKKRIKLETVKPEKLPEIVIPKKPQVIQLAWDF